MKATNYFKFLWLFVLALVVNSCVDDNDFSIPPTKGVEPNVKVNKTISDVLSMFKDGETVVFSDNDVVEGYVVSSDEANNFYQKIIIQDKAENPTAAVEIRVNGRNLYTSYEIGRKVYVKLKGLGLNDYKGTKQIGAIEGNSLGLIPSASYKDVILRSTTLETVVPKVVTVADVKAGKVPVGVLVKLENMFSPDKGKTYAEEKKNTNRTLESCKGGKITLRTSGYSSFYNQKVPEKSGSVVAVLGVYSTTYQLAIRDTNDITFNQDSCQDNGGGTDPVGEVVSELNETFDAVTPRETVSLKGWINTSKGSRKWVGAEFSGEKYAQVSGFKASEAEVEAWLVTPGLDLSKAENKNFSFDSKRGHSKGEVLEVLISSDFKGNVNSATWQKLGAKFPEAVPTGYGKAFLNSGDIDLSAFSGVVHVALKYVGNNTDKSGTYQVDNIKFNYKKDNTGGGSTNADLYISEYAEGSSQNKYIEIYNGTGTSVDLSKYQVWGSSNGSGWKKAREISLSGTLASGDVYVISTDQSVDEILDKADLKLPYESPVHFNGDDAIGLAKDNGSGTYELIDVIGTPDSDPGTAWSVSGQTNATKDHTLVRKSSIKKGSINWDTSSSNEWEVKDKNDFTSLGSR